MSFIMKNLMLSDHFEVILRFGLGNHQGTTGFIRYFNQLFRMLQNVVLLKGFDVLQSHEMLSRFTENAMLYNITFSTFWRNGPKKNQKALGFQ